MLTAEGTKLHYWAFKSKSVVIMIGQVNTVDDDDTELCSDDLYE